jgi:hypothetical protein
MDDLMLSQVKTMRMVEMEIATLESWSTCWAHAAYERYIGNEIDSSTLHEWWWHGLIKRWSKIVMYNC